MSEQFENRLRELFAELRDEDEQHVPPFSTTLAAALAGQRRPRRSWRWAVPVAVAMLLVAAVLLWQRPTGPRDATRAADAALAEWVAPSTTFLQLDGAGLLDLSDRTVGDSPLPDDDLWDLPSDTLLQDADATFGEEIKL